MSFARQNCVPQVSTRGLSLSGEGVSAGSEFMDTVPHYKLCEREQLANLRPADPFMMQTTVSAREWPPPENFDESQWERNVNK